MRTITLELLRHGPAHNQLLSPLTPYLALCENHAAVTLHVPFEHNQFLYRLSALGYKLAEESRRFQLADTARVMGEIFSVIPGLTAESGKNCACEDGDGASGPLTHLRLIISSSELALLPFELALAPQGFPGAGQQLLLQPEMPICLTREIRRVPNEQFQWPKTPKILFAAAAPPEVAATPLESHLLVLRRIVAPWVRHFSDDAMRRQKVAEHLVFLPGASIESIETHCATGEFTHVHILAHGVERRDKYDTRFCLVLHDAQDPNKADYISGTRLATALRASQRPDGRSLSRPAVVTLASCDSGNQGSVAGAGASIAHAVHEAGIPMVIAGQFPLSFEGSVRLTEVLYEGLMWGVDPRLLLYDLRRRLYAQFPERHDWASLTAYVSLPPDFEDQLSGVQIEQAMQSINAAMNHADWAIRSLFVRIRTRRGTPETPEPAPEAKHRLLETARRKIENAKARLERLLTLLPRERAQIHGLLASTHKRHAEVLFSSKRSSLMSDEKKRHDLKESIRLLQQARDHYWDAFVLDRSKSWAVVQYLSLTLVMRQRPLDPEVMPEQLLPQVELQPDHGEKDPVALWSLAHLVSRYDLRSSDQDRAIWGHGNLIELYLLLPLMPVQPVLTFDPVQEMRRLTDAMIELAGRDSFSLYSTRRQIFRYVEWFNELFDIQSVTQLAEEVFEKFPGDVEDRWQ
jgi:CHAT domain/Tetratricopeptide Repeats-Sensor